MAEQAIKSYLEVLKITQILIFSGYLPEWKPPTRRTNLKSIDIHKSSMIGKSPNGTNEEFGPTIGERNTWDFFFVPLRLMTFFFGIGKVRFFLDCFTSMFHWNLPMWIHHVLVGPTTNLSTTKRTLNVMSDWKSVNSVKLRRKLFGNDLGSTSTFTKRNSVTVVRPMVEWLVHERCLSVHSQFPLLQKRRTNQPSFSIFSFGSTALDFGPWRRCRALKMEMLDFLKDVCVQV